jgi:moderate conductance mechanosensitive channel
MNLMTVIHVSIIVFLGLLAYTLFGITSRRIEKNLNLLAEGSERKQRLKTLLQAGRYIGHVIILLVVILMALHELEINIFPILASAGVAGLALSLGAQTIIRDFIGGVILLVENQFKVGDTIRIGDQTGKVEQITLRATYLRDLEGNRIAVPNGDIRTVANLSKEWARAVVTLSVPLHVNMDQVMAALNQAVQEAGQDEQIASFLLASPTTQGWVDLTDTAVRVRLLAETKPGKQWEVAQVLRKYAIEKLRSVT